MEELGIGLDHSQTRPSPAFMYSPAQPPPNHPPPPHTLTPEQLHSTPKSSPEGGGVEEGEEGKGEKEGDPDKPGGVGERPPSPSQLESTGGANLDSSNYSAVCGTRANTMPYSELMYLLTH